MSEKFPYDVVMFKIGYLRRDDFGRLYIDSCSTDAEHITKKPEPGEERLRCRKYIEDLFPTSLDGKKIELRIDFGARVLAEPEEEQHERVQADRCGDRSQGTKS